MSALAENVVPFPLDLTARRQWLVWRFEDGEAGKKPRKMPYYASGRRRGGTQGDDADRAALVTYAEAKAALAKGKYTGLGFAFLPGDGLIGIDIDGAFGDEGERKDRALGVISACASFTEWSPSGNGVHIIVAGETKTFKNNGVGIEVFCGRQFFTMTGNTFDGAPLEVNPIRDSVLDRLRIVVKGEAPQVVPPASPRPTPVATSNRVAANDELDPARLESALSYVTADDYHEWVNFGMALKSSLGEGGFAVWDFWSSKAAAYGGSDATYKKWSSFPVSSALTVASIYKAAVNAGWKPPRNESRHVPAAYSPAPALNDAEQSTSPQPQGGSGEVAYDLAGVLRDFCMVTGPKSLSVWHTHEKYDMGKGAFEALVGKEVAKEWIASGAKRTIKQADVRALKRLRDDEDRSADDEFVELCDRYIYLDGSASVWDERLRIVVGQSAVKMAMGAAFDLWVNSPQRKKIPQTNVVFDPLQKCNTETHINLFRGLPLQPKYDLAAAKPIIDLIYHLCNDVGEDAEWLIRWLAYPLQNVGAKMATAVLMHSKTHGSGKSWLFEECIKPLYGEYGATLGQHQLESNYTGWMSKRLFGLFEEVLASNQRYSHTGTLKHMITGKTQNIEKKFVDSWEESNHMNSVFLSNSLQPFHVEDSDRRFMVIWPEETTPLELKLRVDEALKGDGLLAFYGFLLNYPMEYKTLVDGVVVDECFGPHTKPVMNAAKRRLIEFGLSGWELFLKEWESGEFGEGSFCSCLTQDLYALWRYWANETNEKAKDSMSQNRFSSSVGAVYSKAKRKFKAPIIGEHQLATFKVGKMPKGITEKDWLGPQIVSFRQAAMAYGVPEDDLFDLVKSKRLANARDGVPG